MVTKEEREEIELLEKKVTETEQKYNRIIDFIKKATEDIGELVHYKLFDYNTEERRELDIDGLKLILDTGHSQFGGNYAEVHVGNTTVLNLYYQAPSDTPERTAYKPGDWENKLQNLIKNQKKVLNDYKKEHSEEYKAKKLREKKLVKEENHYSTQELNERLSSRRSRSSQREEEEENRLREKKQELEKKAKKLGINS